APPAASPATIRPAICRGMACCRRLPAERSPAGKPRRSPDRTASIGGSPAPEETPKNGSAAQRLLRRPVFRHQPRHPLRRIRDVVDRADALAGAPDVAPGLDRLAAARVEVHLAGAALRQVVRVE